MMLSKDMLPNIPIKDATPDIFRRPILFVDPNAHIWQIAAFDTYSRFFNDNGYVGSQCGR